VEFFDSLRERQMRMGLQALTDVVRRIDVVLAEQAAIVESVGSADATAAAAAMGKHLSKTLAALQVAGERLAMRPLPVAWVEMSSG
jgi:DNA-binding GntR family transcriptional regulator